MDVTFSGRKYGILINLVNLLVKCKLQKKQNADLKFFIDELLLISQGKPEVVVIRKINSWHLRKKWRNVSMTAVYTRPHGSPDNIITHTLRNLE